MSSTTPDVPRHEDQAFRIRSAGIEYQMVLPHAETDHIQKLLATTGAPYEPEMLLDMAARLSAGDLVIDVGANIGNHSLYLAAVAGCRLYSYEPNRALAGAMQRSLALNGLESQVEVRQVGIGAGPGRATLVEDKPTNLGAQHLDLGAGDIEIRSIDELHAGDDVKAMKIDVEGMECDVLSGAEATIARCRPLIYLEAINDIAFRALVRWLEPRGYICWDTFNATPTHLFMPAERVSVGDQLRRLQTKVFQDTYRTGLLLTSVRSRLGAAQDHDKLLTGKLLDLHVSHTELIRQIADARELARANAADLHHSREAIGRLNAELKTSRAEAAGLALQLAQARSQLKAQAERAAAMAADAARLRTVVREREALRKQAVVEHQRVLQTVRYRLGEALVDSLRSPRDLLRLPLRVWRACRRAAPSAAVHRPQATAERSAPPRQAPSSARPTPQAPRVPMTRLVGDLQRHLKTGLLLPPGRKALFDGMPSFQPLDAASPDVAADLWLLDLRLLCRLGQDEPAVARSWEQFMRQRLQRGAPTVAWCDPEARGLPQALDWLRLAHVVLAEDADDAAVLHHLLDHAQVHVWPVWARPDRAHPFTARGMAADAEPLRVEVDAPDAQSQTVLTEGVLEAALRQCRPSQPVHRAARVHWGDWVGLEPRAALSLGEPSQPGFNQARAHLAWRKACSEHTATARMARLSAWVCRPDSPRASRADVACLAQADTADTLSAVVEAWRRQTLGTALVVLAPAGLVPASPAPAGLTVVPDRASAGRALADLGAAWVAVLDAKDRYGPDYLQDLWCASLCCVAEVYAKACADQPRWQCEAGATPWRRSLVAAAAAMPALSRPDGPTALGELRFEAVSTAVADAFDYGPDGAAWVDAGQAAGGPAVPPAWPQVESIIDRSLAELPRLPSGSRLSAPVRLIAGELAARMPGTLPTGLSWRLDGDELELTWAGVTDGVVYVNLASPIAAQELLPGQPTQWVVEGHARGDIRLALIYQDDAGRKLGHAMRQIGGRSDMLTPTSARHVALAFRLKAAASARVRGISLAEVPLPMRLPIPVAPVLLVCKQYPSPDDLYRFGFVHSRVRGYGRMGLSVEVFRVSQDIRGSFREFEGVPVQEGDANRLIQVLRHAQHEAVLVHYLDPQVWQALQEALPTRRVIVWVHGAEIQPWWRRAYVHETDAARDQARKGSDARMQMWAEVMAYPGDNLTLVFVSRKQAAEAFCDLGLTLPPHRYRIISNFIDESIFPYRPKTAEHRRRVLSIRPYASAVYANDLTVRAIQLLAEREGFGDLEFRLIGDGPLFDDTVAPLRQYPNVTLVKGFLTQHEIARVHEDHGIFLVPSRMDSQGVSRDEAMCSGLVPISTHIAAIPEFVTPQCALLTPPEDARALADAVMALQQDPQRFLQMSQAAAAHVRSRSGAAQTVQREADLIRSVPPPDGFEPVRRPPLHLVVCGDLNINVMDGSAIWAASLCETLALLPRVGITLLCKARIHRTPVIERLLDLSPQVRIVEPALASRDAALNVPGLVDHLLAIDRQHRADGFILRGFDLCEAAANQPALRDRLWAYLTDIPQQAQDITPDVHRRIAGILANCRVLLCQTPHLEQFVHEHWPQARGKTAILPPMVPPATRAQAVSRPVGMPLRLGYAGKFAPRWGIRELLRCFAALRQQVPDAQLHVYGDKIHQAADDPGFRDEIRQALQTQDGLIWHGAVSRNELMQALAELDVCWAYRDPQFEAATRELSTKVLEYASISVPMILARSGPNIEALGADYPLFADDEATAARHLLALAQSAELRASAVAAYADLARRHAFEAVALAFAAQPLISDLLASGSRRPSA